MQSTVVRRTWAERFVVSGADLRGTENQFLSRGGARVPLWDRRAVLLLGMLCPDTDPPGAVRP